MSNECKNYISIYQKRKNLYLKSNRKNTDVGNVTFIKAVKIKIC